MRHLFRVAAEGTLDSLASGTFATQTQLASAATVALETSGPTAVAAGPPRAARPADHGGPGSLEECLESAPVEAADGSTTEARGTVAVEAATPPPTQLTLATSGGTKTKGSEPPDMERPASQPDRDAKPEVGRGGDRAQAADLPPWAEMASQPLVSAPPGRERPDEPAPLLPRRLFAEEAAGPASGPGSELPGRRGEAERAPDEGSPASRADAGPPSERTDTGAEPDLAGAPGRRAGASPHPREAGRAACLGKDNSAAKALEISQPTEPSPPLQTALAPEGGAPTADAVEISLLTQHGPPLQKGSAPEGGTPIADAVEISLLTQPSPPLQKSSAPEGNKSTMSAVETSQLTEPSPLSWACVEPNHERQLASAPEGGAPTADAAEISLLTQPGPPLQEASAPEDGADVEISLLTQPSPHQQEAAAPKGGTRAAEATEIGQLTQSSHRPLVIEGGSSMEDALEIGQLSTPPAQPSPREEAQEGSVPRRAARADHATEEIILYHII